MKDTTQYDIMMSVWSLELTTTEEERVYHERRIDYLNHYLEEERRWELEK